MKKDSSLRKRVKSRLEKENDTSTTALIVRMDSGLAKRFKEACVKDEQKINSVLVALVKEYIGETE